jgi:hypothetical protein
MRVILSLRQILGTWPTVALALVLVLFVWLRSLELAGRLGGLQASYGDDLICLPLILSGILVVQRRFGSLGRRVLPVSHGLVAFAAYSLYFEAVLPYIGTRFTADPMDLMVYGMGWGLFELLINRPLRSRDLVAA